MPDNEAIIGFLELLTDKLKTTNNPKATDVTENYISKIIKFLNEISQPIESLNENEKAKNKKNISLKSYLESCLAKLQRFHKCLILYPHSKNQFNKSLSFIA